MVPAGEDQGWVWSHFSVVPDRSAVLIEARSNVGPIAFGTTSVSGHLEVQRLGGLLTTIPPPDATLSLDLRTLRSGNSLYDAELARRLDVRRYPISTIVLRDVEPMTEPHRYRVVGEMTLHGVTRDIEGSVSATVDATGTGTCEITGEQAFDIRDFDIASPSALMLRIYPDVRVHLKLNLEQRLE
jgi:hypothetical protein